MGNFQDYGFREYDTRIARFNSVDPLTKKFPSLTSYQFAANSPLKFVDLDGKEMYVMGTGADEYINMMSNLTGLSIAKDPISGLLSYATTTATMTGPTGAISTQQKPIIKVSNTFQSVNLRNEVIKTIDGVKGVAPVTIKASSTQLSTVAYDDYRTNEVDMADFRAANNFPELQAALSGHLLRERNHILNLSNLSFKAKYNVTHIDALKFEGSIMREFDPKASDRTTNTESKYLKKILSNTDLGGNLNDYNSQKYLNVIPNPSNSSTPTNPNEIINVIQVK